MQRWVVPAFFALVIVVCCVPFSEGISVEKDLSLTLSQKNALDKFRAKVNPLLTKRHMKQDIYLIRWLRARDFNLNAAEAMLRQNLKWRKENNMDTIQTENLDDMKKDYHATIDTYDKEGRPIGVIDIFSWDIRRATIQGKGQRLLRYMDYLLDNITGQIYERQERGMNVTQFTVLGGADGFNLVEHACPLCIPLWIQFVQSLENNFSGWMHELIVIDAPSTINVILDIVRPFLHRQTRDALRIFGPNKAKWMPYIEARIAPDERRPQYGGTRPNIQDL